MFHLLKWLYPGMKMKRWLLLFAIGVMLFSFGGALAINYEYLGRVEEEIFMLVYRAVGSYNYMATTIVGLFGVPIEIATLIFCIDALSDRLGTCVNVLSNMTVTVTLARTENLFDEKIYFGS